MVNSIVVTPRTKANPLHQFDYEARLDCSDEAGLVVGYGRTPQEAINDLPEGDIRIIDETEAAFIVAVKVPKALVGRNREALRALLEAAIAGEADNDA